MHYSICALLDDDEGVRSWFLNAKRIWGEILTSEESKEVSTLARVVSLRQPEFESQCGTRFVGQEVMAWVGIAQFYRIEDGFGDRLKKAKAAYSAMQESWCSVEVKFHARRAAESYGLDEYEDE